MSMSDMIISARRETKLTIACSRPIAIGTRDAQRHSLSTQQRQSFWTLWVVVYVQHPLKRLFCGISMLIQRFNAILIGETFSYPDESPDFEPLSTLAFSNW